RPGGAVRVDEAGADVARQAPRRAHEPRLAVGVRRAHVPAAALVDVADRRGARITARLQRRSLDAGIMEAVADIGRDAAGWIGVADLRHARVARGEERLPWRALVV